MQAFRRIAPGQAALREVAPASVGEDETLIEVVCAGVNPFDRQVLRGEIGDPAAVLTLGAEATGRVDGTLVHVSGHGLGAARDGTFAPYVAVPSAAIVPLPSSVDPYAAAAIGVAGKTAWRAIHQLAGVGREDVVLVLGGAGGVGMFAAQYAAGAGARVIAQTATPDKGRVLEEIGISTVVAADPRQLVEGLDGARPTVVLDPLGGDYVATLLPALAPSARVVVYGVLAGRTSELDLATLYGAGITLIGTSGRTTPPEQAREALVGALGAVAAGTVRIPYEVMPLDRAAEAFARLESRTVTGKLLLQP
jgi:NADPH2:quinone reductase